MRRIKIKELLLRAGTYRVISGTDETAVNGIEESSGEVKPGRVFVCVKGLSADGHDFAPAAAGRGAAVIIADRPIKVKGKAAIIYVKDSRDTLFKITHAFYAAVKKKVKVTGVTGTKGKTTVTYMIAAMLEAEFKKPVAVIGTVAYRIGKKIYKSNNTTPSNLVLHKLIAEAAGRGIKNVVMEISSHALDQERAKNIGLDAAVVTNVTRDHFDYHKTFEKYLAAKLKIVKAVKRGGALVLNLDDKNAGAFIKRAGGRKVITCSLSKKADIRTFKYYFDVRGMELQLDVMGCPLKLETKLVGEHNAHNIMTAIGAACGIVSLKNIRKALEAFRGVKGRMQAVYNRDFTVIVDFAHTAGSLEETLKALNKVKKARVITVFGAGGNRDKGKRPMMGAVAERLSDVVIVTSDNPRFEEPLEIIKDILAGISGRVLNYVEEKREKAVRLAVKIARKGDIILLAGKGHETYQDIKGKKWPYDDEHEALRAIKEIRK